ncbi:hypothetical protein EBZU44_14600 [Enterobacter cloacae]|nr:hypothetical protein EBZU44_14600 [Enterobacter cloacae]
MTTRIETKKTIAKHGDTSPFCGQRRMMCYTVDAASQTTGDRKATLGQLFAQYFPPTLAIPRGRTAAHNRKLHAIKHVNAASHK